LPGVPGVPGVPPPGAPLLGFQSGSFGGLAPTPAAAGSALRAVVPAAPPLAFPGSPTHKWEHVERFSAQLLSQIDGLLGDGIAAFGEIFAGTVCNQTASCTCADLRDAGYVQRQGLLHAWSKPVSRRDLRRLFSSANKAVNLNDTRGREGVQDAGLTR
jgi:hypothetical protein